MISKDKPAADSATFIPPPPEARNFEPTQAQRMIVSALVACNVRLDGIAAYMHLTMYALNKHFQGEINGGYERTEAMLTGILSAKAMQGNLTAVLFLLKTKFGWRETTRQAGAGEISFDQLSDASKAQLIADLRSSLKPGKIPGKTPRRLTAVDDDEADEITEADEAATG